MTSTLPSPCWLMSTVSPRLPTRLSTLILSCRNFSKAAMSKILSDTGCEALIMYCDGERGGGLISQGRGREGPGLGWNVEWFIGGKRGKKHIYIYTYIFEKEERRDSYLLGDFGLLALGACGATFFLHLPNTLAYCSLFTQARKAWDGTAKRCGWGRTVAGGIGNSLWGGRKEMFILRLDCWKYFGICGFQFA